MSSMTVQCKGSGSSPRTFTTNKKAQCGYCQKSVEISGTGKLRKHTVRKTKAQMRAGR
jgi:aerobic-type carbon monoxide dehydrogenase small subunit (CoxS/CutS family)